MLVPILMAGLATTWLSSAAGLGELTVIHDRPPPMEELKPCAVSIY